MFASRLGNVLLRAPAPSRWRTFSQAKVLLPTITPSEAKEYGVKFDQANLVHYVDQDQMVEALQRFVTVRTPTGNYRDTKTRLHVPFADRDLVKAKHGKFDSDANSWFAPAGLDLNEFNAWLKEPQKVYLEVPFAEKEEAKQLGAMFDKTCSKWYFDANRSDRRSFAKWKEAILDKSGRVAPRRKRYLAIPFAEKDEAKQLGCNFDGETKQWYFDENMYSRDRFAKWPDAPMASSGGTRPAFVRVEEEDRAYMEVPFEEKDEVKALGARFDPARRMWYFDKSNPSNRTRFTKWKVMEEEQ